MLEELTADEWAEWVSFFMLEPWGFDVADGFNALLASTVARTWGADVSVEQFLMGRLMEARVEEPDLEAKIKRLFGHKDFVKSPPEARS